MCLFLICICDTTERGWDLFGTCRRLVGDAKKMNGGVRRVSPYFSHEFDSLQTRKLWLVGWLVSRPTVTRVTFDLKNEKRRKQKKHEKKRIF